MEPEGNTTLLIPRRVAKAEKKLVRFGTPPPPPLFEGDDEAIPPAPLTPPQAIVGQSSQVVMAKPSTARQLMKVPPRHDYGIPPPPPPTVRRTTQQVPRSSTTRTVQQQQYDNDMLDILFSPLNPGDLDYVTSQSTIRGDDDDVGGGNTSSINGGIFGMLCGTLADINDSCSYITVETEREYMMHTTIYDDGED